jgi:hypothetical protein
VVACVAGMRVIRPDRMRPGRCRRACAKGQEWSGARDPINQQRPIQRVGRHVERKTPLGFAQGRRCSKECPRGVAV